MENDFAEHVGPPMSLQDLIFLKEDGIAGDSEIDGSMVTRIPGLGDKERPAEKTG